MKTLKTEKLLTLEKFTLPAKEWEGILERCHQELFGHHRLRSSEGEPWGYFPGWEKDERTLYPATMTLADWLQANVMGPWEQRSGLVFHLNFVKLAPQKVQARLGGFHFDPLAREYEHRPVEILRFLFNLSPHPRHFAYWTITRWELETQGYRASRCEYQTLDEFSAYQETRVLEIPGYRQGELWGLRFWSSLIPHRGYDDERGHFLAAYDAFCPGPLTSSKCPGANSVQNSL